MPPIRGERSEIRCLVVIWLLCAALVLVGLSLRAVSAEGPMLPQVYSEQEVSGWLMSEKLDGVRGHWDGRQLLSKNGHPFHPPVAFTRGLPPFPLEGEIWGGHGGFERTVSTVAREESHDGWLELQFAVFDVPRAPGGFAERIAAAEAWFAAHPSPHAYVIPQVPVRDREHLHRELQRVEALGSEGLIVRSPDALYVGGRSPQILKVKSYQDAEATVVAHLPGEGRNEGRLGSLLVEREDGTRFRIGTGFSDAERESPPPVGAVVTYKHYGEYASGLPRFPSFLRIRRDQGL